jgi:hypothetical protein
MLCVPIALYSLYVTLLSLVLHPLAQPLLPSFYIQRKRACLTHKVWFFSAPIDAVLISSISLMVVLIHKEKAFTVLVFDLLLALECFI